MPLLKMPLRFCANLSFMFQETSSLLERYELAKHAGFKAVECAFPYDFTPNQVAEAKKQAGLQQILINAYPGNWANGERGLAAISGKTEEFRASLVKTVEYAKALDCKIIHIMAGIAEHDSASAMSTYVANLEIATAILKESNIIGVIEPINKYSLPEYFLNNFEKGLNVIKEINSPHLKLQLDIFHLQQIAGNLTRNIESLLPHVGHIQIAQVPLRNEPDTPGEVDYGYVFTLLERLGYDGWIGLEYSPKASTQEGLKWFEKMGQLL